MGASEHLLLKNRMLLPSVFYFFFAMLGVKSRYLCMLDKNSTAGYPTSILFLILECEVSDMFKRLELWPYESSVAFSCEIRQSFFLAKILI